MEIIKKLNNFFKEKKILIRAEKGKRTIRFLKFYEWDFNLKSGYYISKSKVNNILSQYGLNIDDFKK